MRLYATCVLLAATLVAGQAVKAMPSSESPTNSGQAPRGNAEHPLPMSTDPDTLPAYIRCDLPSSRTPAGVSATAASSGTCAWTTPGTEPVQAPFELIVPALHTMAETEVVFQAVWWKPHDVDQSQATVTFQHAGVSLAELHLTIVSSTSSTSSTSESGVEWSWNLAPQSSTVHGMSKALDHTGGWTSIAVRMEVSSSGWLMKVAPCADVYTCEWADALPTRVSLDVDEGSSMSVQVKNSVRVGLSALDPSRRSRGWFPNF